MKGLVCCCYVANFVVVVFVELACVAEEKPFLFAEAGFYKLDVCRTCHPSNQAV